MEHDYEAFLKTYPELTLLRKLQGAFNGFKVPQVCPFIVYIGLAEKVPGTPDIRRPREDVFIILRSEVNAVDGVSGASIKISISRFLVQTKEVTANKRLALIEKLKCEKLTQFTRTINFCT